MSKADAEIRLIRLLHRRQKFTAGELRWAIRFFALIGVVQERANRMAVTEEHRLEHTSVALPSGDKARLDVAAKALSEPGYTVDRSAIIRAAVHLALNSLDKLVLEAELTELEIAANMVLAQSAKLHPETARRLRLKFRER